MYAFVGFFSEPFHPFALWVGGFITPLVFGVAWVVGWVWHWTGLGRIALFEGIILMAWMYVLRDFVGELA